MQNDSALRLINNAAAADAAAADVLATSKSPGRVLSPAAQAAQQTFAWLSQEYGSPNVPDATRHAYDALARNYPVGPTGQTTGKAVWMSINTLRLQMEMDVLLAPPLYREQAGIVPAYTVTASVSSSAVLTLTVTPDTAFSGYSVLASATKSLTAATMRLRTTDYQALQVSDGLMTPVLDLSASWVRVYGRVPGVGTRIGVCLLPASANGFPGQPVYRDALVVAG